MKKYHGPNKLQKFFIWVTQLLMKPWKNTHQFLLCFMHHVWINIFSPLNLLSIKKMSILNHNFYPLYPNNNWVNYGSVGLSNGTRCGVLKYLDQCSIPRKIMWCLIGQVNFNKPHLPPPILAILFALYEKHIKILYKSQFLQILLCYFCIQFWNIGSQNELKYCCLNLFVKFIFQKKLSF